MDWTSPLRSQQSSFIDRLRNTLSDRAAHATGLLEASYQADAASQSQIEQLLFTSATASELRATSRSLILESDPSLSVRELLFQYLREQLTQLTLTRAIGESVDIKTMADYLALDRQGMFSIDLDAFRSDLDDDDTASSHTVHPCRLRVLLCEGERSIEELTWSYDRSIEDADLVLCLWIREPVTETGNRYRVVLAGFLPKPPRGRGTVSSVAIGDLLYIGGLPYYLDSIARFDNTPSQTSTWFNTLTSAPHYVYPFAIGADGKTIASSSYDGSLRIWTTENTELISALAGPVRSMSPSSSLSGSQSLSSDTAEKSFELWQSGSAVLAQNLVGHPSRISAVTLSPSSEIALAGCDDGSIAIWDVKAGTTRQQIAAHRTSVKALVVSEDERLLVSSATDRTLKVWDLRSGELKFELDCGRDVTIALAIDTQNDFLVSGTQSGQIYIWNLADGSLDRELTAHAGVVQALTISPDGQQLASASTERTIKVWNLATGEREETLTGHAMPTIALAPQSGSKWLDLSLFQHREPGWTHL